MPGVSLNPTVGPQTVSDGGETNPRAGRNKELIVGDVGKGRYYEATSRGSVWTISTPQGGITVTALMVVSAASANGICAIFNPANSGTNLSITRGTLIMASALTAATATTFVWGIIPTPTGITGAGVSATNNLTGITGGHAARAFNGSAAVVGAAAANILRPFAGAVNGTIAAGTPTTFEEVTDGDIVVGPGVAVGLYALTATVGLVVYGSITWAEVAA